MIYNSPSINKNSNGAQLLANHYESFYEYAGNQQTYQITIPNSSSNHGILIIKSYNFGMGFPTNFESLIDINWDINSATTLINEDASRTISVNMATHQIIITYRNTTMTRGFIYLDA